MDVMGPSDAVRKALAEVETDRVKRGVVRPALSKPTQGPNPRRSKPTQDPNPRSCARAPAQLAFA
eukprot:498544-Prymnesium_polylepis.2